MHCVMAAAKILCQTFTIFAVFYQLFDDYLYTFIQFLVLSTSF